MKYLLPLFFFSLSVQAQVCTEATLLSASYPLNCESLNISSPVNLSSISSAIEIDVTGDVMISSSITLNGYSGLALSVDTNPGAAGGPGGFPGGGRQFNEAVDAPGVSAGEKGTDDPTAGCTDGGAGGGFVEAGKNGFLCTNSNNTPSLGGIIFDYSNIENSLQGGFGGGTGGGNSGTPIFGGGGGGGALFISAGGKITVTSQASITAHGGNGANANNNNGAGGAGSGGVIILAAAQLDVRGALSALGGKGGTAISKGHGGDGSPGLIRLKTASGTQDFIGSKPQIKIDELKLNSAISCGAIKENKESSHLFLQIITPLLLCVALTRLRKKSQAPA